MIVSASRRTDIPAFYAGWFMNRIRAGYCIVPNPFNRGQISTVSLKPEDVDVIVFWTRNPRPLFPHLPELDQHGYRYYFQHTLLGYPRPIEPKSPPADTAIRTFRQIADRIGPEKVIWRYDPLVFTEITDHSFHRRTYQRTAQALRGYTRRSVISIMDVYPKAEKRLQELARQGAALTLPIDPCESNAPSMDGSWAGPGHPFDAWRLVENRPALLRVGHPNAGSLRAGPGRAAGAALQSALAQPSSVDHITRARFKSSSEAQPLTTSRGAAPWTREAWFGGLMRGLAETAHANGMEVVSCAEEVDLTPFGIRPGKCVDDGYIRLVFGLDVMHTKDPSQRPACGCVVSKDIGMYNSCLFGCQYCYAVSSFAGAKYNYDRHDPQSPSLLAR